MYAIEFQSKVKDGVIEIPERYRGQIGRQVRVIVLTEAQTSTGDMIDQLLEKPVKMKGFTPLTRGEVYER